MGNESKEQESQEHLDGLVAKLAETTFLIRALRLQLLLEDKANFNPNQPRVPRGYRFGGRWTKPGSGWGRPIRRDVATKPRFIHASHEPEEPKVPERRPGTTSERNRIGRAVARYLKELPAYRQALFLARAGWLLNEAGHTIRSYFDEPRSLRELKERAFQPRAGYDVHHIVEKTPARSEGFPEWQIEGNGNKVLTPRYKHWEITAGMEPRTSGLVDFLPGNICGEEVGKRNIGPGLRC